MLSVYFISSLVFCSSLFLAYCSPAESVFAFSFLLEINSEELLVNVWFVPVVMVLVVVCLFVCVFSPVLVVPPVTSYITVYVSFV
jgi:hypothetical protein